MRGSPSPSPSYPTPPLRELDKHHSRIQEKSSLALSPTSKKAGRHNVPRSVLRAVLGRMQLTLHATRRTPHSA